MRKATEHLRAAAKYVASFLKRDWNLTDYPLRIRRLRSEHNVNGGGPIKWDHWNAQIVKWPQMRGGGRTREEAYKKLLQQFEDYKRGGSVLPRPGTVVPLEFCPTGEIETYQEFAKGFLKRILRLDSDPLVVLTDDSSLWHFTLFHEVTEDELVARVQAEYDVDVSDIEDGNLVTIFNRIQRKNSQA